MKKKSPQSGCSFVASVFTFISLLSVCELNLQLIPCCSYVLLMFVPCDSHRHNTNILIINWQEVVLSQVFLNLQNKQCSTHFGAEVFWWMLFVFWNMMVLMNAPGHIKNCRIARCCVFVCMGTLLCVCVYLIVMFTCWEYVCKGDVWLDVCKGAVYLCMWWWCLYPVYMWEWYACVLCYECVFMSILWWCCVFVYVIRLSVCCEGGAAFVHEKKDPVAKIYQFKMNTCSIDSLHAYSRYSVQLWIISFLFDYAVINVVTWMLFCDIIGI